MTLINQIRTSLEMDVRGESSRGQTISIPVEVDGRVFDLGEGNIKLQANRCAVESIQSNKPGRQKTLDPFFYGREL